MLNLIYQRAKAKDVRSVRVDSRAFFSNKKKVEWFKDPFVQEIIGTVDHCRVIDGFVLENEEGNVIPPEYLSTGSKTAICVYEFPELIFNATQMGDNAFAFVLKLAKTRDVTVLTYRMLPYNWLKRLQVCKDYEPVDLGDWQRFAVLQDEWLEEIYND